MPGLDGSGPRGQGAMTGGGFGRCGGGPGRGGYGGYGGYGGRGLGRGFGRGFGVGPGRGYGRAWAWSQEAESPADDKAAMEQRLQWLEQEVGRVRERLATMND